MKTETSFIDEETVSKCQLIHVYRKHCCWRKLNQQHFSGGSDLSCGAEIRMFSLFLHNFLADIGAVADILVVETGVTIILFSVVISMFQRDQSTAGVGQTHSHHYTMKLHPRGRKFLYYKIGIF